MCGLLGKAGLHKRLKTQDLVENGWKMLKNHNIKNYFCGKSRLFLWQNYLYF